MYLLWTKDSFWGKKKMPFCTLSRCFAPHNNSPLKWTQLALTSEEWGHGMKSGLVVILERLGESCLWKKKSSFRLYPVTPVCPCLLSVPLCKVDYHKALIRITERTVFFYLQCLCILTSLFWFSFTCFWALIWEWESGSCAIMIYVDFH